MDLFLGDDFLSPGVGRVGILSNVHMHTSVKFSKVLDGFVLTLTKFRLCRARMLSVSPDFSPAIAIADDEVVVQTSTKPFNISQSYNMFHGIAAFTIRTNQSKQPPQ